MKVVVDVKKIIVAMAENGYDIKDLAESSNVTFQAVYNVLSGKRRGTTKVLGNICKTLGITVNDVIEIQN